MAEWSVDARAAALHREALVWDMTLPWQMWLEPKSGTLERFAAAGFDFVSLMFPNGYPPPPWHYFPPEEAPRLTEALLRRGFAMADIRGIRGENFLRVCEQVWK